MNHRVTTRSRILPAQANPQPVCRNGYGFGAISPRTMGTWPHRLIQLPLAKKCAGALRSKFCYILTGFRPVAWSSVCVGRAYQRFRRQTGPSRQVTMRPI
jgi:hypothetical protein